MHLFNRYKCISSVDTEVVSQTAACLPMVTDLTADHPAGTNKKAGARPAFHRAT
jgi:hypothetical protein